MIKKTCLKTYTALVALAVLAVLSGCQNKGVRVKDVNGALYVCRSDPCERCEWRIVCLQV